MHTSKEEAEVFRQLAEGFGPSGHPNFFAILVEQLARLLNVDHALVAVVTEANIAETLAVWSSGALQANITYPLAKPWWAMSPVCTPAMCNPAFQKTIS